MMDLDLGRIRETLLDLAARRARALCEGDTRALGEMLAEGFVYTNSQGTRLDREGYLDFVASGGMKWSAQLLENVEVHSFGEAVVMTCRVADVGHYQGEPVRWHFASTQVYIRRGESWAYAAGHTSNADE